MLLLGCALPLAAAEAGAASIPDIPPPAAPEETPPPPQAKVYFESGSDTAAISRQLAPFRRLFPQGDVQFVPTNTAARSLQDAVHAAEAVTAGIAEMPSLVLADTEGAFAALPLRTLTEESLQAALPRAAAPERAAEAAARRYSAEQYLLFARMALVHPLGPEELRLCLESCRALMNSPQAGTADKQLLGLRCLYPLLLEEYRQGYAAAGAHTPATEAKLLEAIAALEAARDLAPQSSLGQQAHAERERLRTARRQARAAE